MKLEPNFTSVAYYTGSEDTTQNQPEIKLSKKEKKRKKKAEKKLKKQQKLEKKRVKIEKKADKENKKQRKELKGILVDYHVSDSLIPEEKAFYKKVGKIQEGQNYLEMFTDDVIHDLKLIMKASFTDGTSGTAISNNHDKARVIMEELGAIGFKNVGLGTNIITLRHKKYPGVVFKIALDSYGIDDNINDEWLYRRHPDMYARFICRHQTGLVSVQEAYATILSKERMQDFIGQAYDMLTRLERNYVIVDLSPVNYKNFAVTRDGRLIIIDGSDLVPIPHGVDLLRCKKVVGSKKGKLIRCGGKLHYTANYNRLECPVCENICMPIEMKPKVEITEEQRMILVNNGLTRKEQKALDEYVDELIVQSGFKLPERKEESKEKKSAGKKPKTPVLDFPNIQFDDEEHKQKVMGQVAELSKQLGWGNPFAQDGEEDEDNEDTHEDQVKEDLPEGDPPEENYEGDDSVEDVDNTDEDGYIILESIGERLDRADRENRLDKHGITSSDAETQVQEQHTPEVVEVVDVQTNEVKDTNPASEDFVSAYDTSMGEGEFDTGVSVYSGSGDASTDVEFSEDPCALNIMITGDIKEAFMENGPSVFIATSEDPENWVEIMPPALFGKIVQQLVDKRNEMLHQFHPEESGDSDSE